jgi:NADH-quinone oxidoreductase subunit E
MEEIMPTEVKEQVEEILAPFRGRQGVLIPALQKVQERLGYLPEEAMDEIAKVSGVSTNTIYGVASFYTQFRFVRPGEHALKVCLGTACHVRGAVRIVEALQRELNIEPGETTSDYKFSLETVRCFGSCALAPVMVVDESVYGRMAPSKAKQVLDKFR